MNMNNFKVLLSINPFFRHICHGRTFHCSSQSFTGQRIAGELEIDDNLRLEPSPEPDTDHELRVTDVDYTVNDEIDRILPKTNEEFFVQKKLPNVSPIDSKSLKVAIIGMPNAGKSTLVNQLVGTRISSVSSKVHTTRKSVIGIMLEGSTQVEFMDTPGLVTSAHCHKHSLEQTFMSHPYHSSRVADVILVVADACNKRDRQGLNQGVIDQLKLNKGKPTALVINKVDAIRSKRRLIEISTQLSGGYINGEQQGDIIINPYTVESPTQQEGRRLANIERRIRVKGHIVDIESWDGVVPVVEEEEEVRIAEPEPYWKHFERIFMVSALEGDGVTDVKDYLLSKAVPQLWNYHPSVITPVSPSLIVVGIVKEKLLEHLPQEMPHKISVQIQSWDVNRVGTIALLVDLNVSKSRLVSIIIGPKGRTIAKIADDSQKALSDAFKTDIVIKLNIKDQDKNAKSRKVVRKS